MLVWIRRDRETIGEGDVLLHFSWSCGGRDLEGFVVVRLGGMGGILESGIAVEEPLGGRREIER